MSLEKLMSQGVWFGVGMPDCSRHTAPDLRHQIANQPNDRKPNKAPKQQHFSSDPPNGSNNTTYKPKTNKAQTKTTHEQNHINKTPLPTVRSQTMWRMCPPPTAYPATAAITGLGRRRICGARWEGARLGLGGCEVGSRSRPPALVLRAPAPKRPTNPQTLPASAVPLPTPHTLPASALPPPKPPT